MSELPGRGLITYFCLNCIKSRAANQKKCEINDETIKESAVNEKEFVICDEPCKLKTFHIWSPNIGQVSFTVRGQA
jgi:hypothetical protein